MFRVIPKSYTSNFREFVCNGQTSLGLAPMTANQQNNNRIAVQQEAPLVLFFPPLSSHVCPPLILPLSLSRKLHAGSIPSFQETRDPIQSLESTFSFQWEDENNISEGP